MERREKIIVGVNEFITEDPAPVDTLLIEDRVHEQQCARLRGVRERRDNERVQRRLATLKQTAEGTGNLMPPILDCVRAHATLGEMCDTLRSVFGEYREPLFD